MIVEPGYLTTEFWGKLVIQLIGVLVLFHIVTFTSEQTQGLLGLATLVLPEIAYAISRGIRKSGTPSLPLPSAAPVDQPGAATKGAV